MDLDALEKELYGGSSGDVDKSGSDDFSTATSSAASSKLSTAPSSKPALSSLSSAPSLKPSSLGSLAPLGKPRPAAAADEDESRESVTEEHTKPGTAMNNKTTAATSGSTKPSTAAATPASAENSSDYVDESFAADAVEEELEIEYEEEEF